MYFKCTWILWVGLVAGRIGLKFWIGAYRGYELDFLRNSSSKQRFDKDLIKHDSHINPWIFLPTRLIKSTGHPSTGIQDCPLRSLLRQNRQTGLGRLLRSSNWRLG